MFRHRNQIFTSLHLVSNLWIGVWMCVFYNLHLSFWLIKDFEFYSSAIDKKNSLIFCTMRFELVLNNISQEQYCKSCMNSVLYRFMSVIYAINGIIRIPLWIPARLLLMLEIMIGICLLDLINENTNYISIILFNKIFTIYN